MLVARLSRFVNGTGSTTALAGAVVVLALGCGVTSGGAGGGGGSAGTTSAASTGAGVAPAQVACGGTFTSRKVCFYYDRLNGSQVDEAKQSCRGDGLPLVADCPLQGLVGGCCYIPASDLSGSDLNVTECFYSGTAKGNEASCTGIEGMWKPR